MQAADKLYTANRNKENDTVFLEIKSKLEEMSRYNTEGAILRSKCAWYESGEKCLKYFLNLEIHKKKQVIC